MSRRRNITLPEAFYEAEWITGAPKVVRSGKEATVYCCQAHPASGVDYLAAKVYRPRERRRFQNDAIYQQGRMIQAVDTSEGLVVGKGGINRRLQRAFRKKTRVGREVQFAAWVGQEYQTLGRLHAAGADVPRPIDWSGSAILMEWVGDGPTPAPQLADISLTPDEARPLFPRLLRNVELWLACDVVHGDLSPFNILYSGDGVKVIDFPQSVDPWQNPNALALLERDLANMCDYFAPYGVRADPSRLARSLWARFRRAEL
jgi:RIO kinase 1